MPKLGDSYNTGKGGEKDTWAYLAEHGYVRPTNSERQAIVELFAKENIIVNKRGFDVISLEGARRTRPWLQVDSL